MRVCLAILILISLLLALGKYTPFYTLFFHYAPFLDRVRYPVRFLFLTVFVISISAGLGYDCLKPDVITMRAARQLGLVADEEDAREKRRVVQLSQLYGVSRGVKPAVLDLYLLVFGGQQWALQFIDVPKCR